jgi:hypothetical protein
MVIQERKDWAMAAFAIRSAFRPGLLGGTTSIMEWVILAIY